MVHTGEFELPTGGEGLRTSEPKTHKGDDTLYAESGPITIFLPDRLDTYEVPESAVILIPEGVRHQYQNFADKTVKGIFSIAPSLYMRMNLGLSVIIEVVSSTALSM